MSRPGYECICKENDRAGSKGGVDPYCPLYRLRSLQKLLLRLLDCLSDAALK